MELIPDMSTTQFVLAFVRFANIYGIPTHIYSDNAKSFIAGDNHISTVFASQKFKETFKIYSIKHVTIPLYEPWIRCCMGEDDKDSQNLSAKNNR